VTHLHEVYERDKKWILGLDTKLLNDFLFPLFIAYICLNFLDVYMTTLAMSFGPVFHEENPVAAALFDSSFRGYLLAIVLKYAPVLPIFYVVFSDNRSADHQFGMKLLKFSVLVALAGADLFLFYVVGVHNLVALMHF
jgi:Domain of unknown function (DUF5658)